MNRRNITTAIMAVGAVVLLYTGVAMAREPEKAPVLGGVAPRATQVVDDRGGDRIHEATSSLDDRGNDARATEPGDDRGTDATLPAASPSLDDRGNDTAKPAAAPTPDDRGKDGATVAAPASPVAPADDHGHDAGGHH